MFLRGALGGTRPWPASPALAVSADGGIAVAVPIGEPGAGDPANLSSLFVYDGTGALSWSEEYSGSGDAWLRAAAFLPDGGIVFAGDAASEDGNGGQDALVLRYSPGGELQWTAADGGDAGEDDRNIAVAVDASGDIVVLGERTNAKTGVDLLIRKHRP